MDSTKRTELQNTKIRLCGIEPEAVVDGPGFRYVIFVQGCPHHCEGCHNPQSHDFDGGYEITLDKLYDEIKSNRHLKGVTFSGGEPFCKARELTLLGREVKALGLDVMTYTGYTYDHLVEENDRDRMSLLEISDILVDGPFVLAKRDITLTFRGSENQRVIDMNATRKKGEIVLREFEY